MSAGLWMHQGEGACDYLSSAHAMRTALEQYLLLHDARSSRFYTFSRECEGMLLSLRILTHPHRQGVKGFLLTHPDRRAGITGIWHHSIEEPVYIQEEQGQRLYRSLRCRHDATIEHSLLWLRTHLLLWMDGCQAAF